MKRVLFVALVAATAYSTVAGRAHAEAPAAGQSRFSQAAIARAVSAGTLDAGRLGDASGQSGAVSVAQTHRAWETFVGTVRPGRVVAVTLMDSTSVKGAVLAVDARSISIEQAGRPRVIEAGDVLRVREAGTRRRHVMRGMLIGMVGGAIATVVIDRQSSHPSSVAEAAGLGAIFIGLPIGAVGGALTPIGPPLYEAAVGRREP